MAKARAYHDSDVWFILRVSSRFRDQIQDRLARERIATYNPVQRIYQSKSKVAKAKGEKRLTVSAPVFSTSLFVMARPSGFLTNLFAGWVKAELLPARHIEGSDGRALLIPKAEMDRFRRDMGEAKYGERTPQDGLIGVNVRKYYHGGRALLGERAYHYDSDIPDTAQADMLTGNEFGPGCIVEFRPGFGPAGTRMTVDKMERYHDGWYAIGRMQMFGSDMATRAKVRGLKRAS